MSKNASVLTLLLCLTATHGIPAAGSPRRISLEGKWRVQLDREDTGMNERWFESSLSQTIQLPGSLPQQGIGDEISADTKWTGDIVDRSWYTQPEYAKYREPGNVKVPFWLQPEKYYVGVAWYQRTVTLPPEWAGQRVVLKLERPHWATRVWLDEREIGSNDSLSTAHQYDLGTVQQERQGGDHAPVEPKMAAGNVRASLAAGQHQLTIRVDNRMVVDVGVNSHSVTDHTQGNWNGLVGEISLRAVAPTWIEDVQIYPSFTSKLVRVKGPLATRPTGLEGARCGSR